MPPAVPGSGLGRDHVDLAVARLVQNGRWCVWLKPGQWRRGHFPTPPCLLCMDNYEWNTQRSMERTSPPRATEAGLVAGDNFQDLLRPEREVPAVLEHEPDAAALFEAHHLAHAALRAPSV
jgi:hypothetical protein